MARDFQDVLASLLVPGLLSAAQPMVKPEAPKPVSVQPLLSAQPVSKSEQDQVPVPKIETDRGKLKSAIVQVETGSEKDPYIFTREKGGKSSAFGPAQITYTLAEEVLKRNPDIQNDPELNKYINDFISQGKRRINEYNKNPRAVSSSLRSGASGLISKDRHEKYYPILFDKALSIKAENQLDPSAIAERWYGNKSAALNKKYANKVMSFYTGD